MTKAKDIETRWWGWGDINKTYPVEDGDVLNIRFNV